MFSGIAGSTNLYFQNKGCCETHTQSVQYWPIKIKLCNQSMLPTVLSALMFFVALMVALGSKNIGLMLRMDVAGSQLGIMGQRFFPTNQLHSEQLV